MTKRFEITDKMAKGFAAEITSKRENLESKKGFHLANIMVNAKFGKTEWDGTYEHINVSWEFLYPFNSVVTNKRRSKIYFNEDACCTIPAKVLLNEIIKGVEDIEHVVELYKIEQFCIIEEGYPKFKEVIEKYGIEWFEKRIAEFYEYLTNLGGSEVYDAPMLNNEESADDIRKSLEDFIYDLDFRPEWCENLDIMNSYSGDYLLIILYGSHVIGLNYEDENDDYIKSDYGWGRADMEYALQIMDNRDEILALAEKMFNRCV